MLRFLILLCLIPKICGTLFPVRTLRVSQCRAACIDELVKIQPLTQTQCSDDENCYMCWDSCHYIEKSSDMCDYEDFCHEECRKACLFYKQKQNVDQQKKGIKRVHDWKFEVPINMHAYTSDIVLRWMPPQKQIAHGDDKTQHINAIDGSSTKTNKRGSIIYALLKKCQHQSIWDVLSETLGSIATLTSTNLCPKGPTEFKLLAISQYGVLAQSGAKYNGTLVPKKDPWKLYLLNMNLNNGSLEAVVVWSATRAKGEFRVTWKDTQHPNVLAGELIIESTIVTLRPLERDTVYLVEVEILNDVDGVRSQPLLVSTHLDKDDYRYLLPTPVLVNPHASCTVGHLLIATCVILAVLVIVLGVGCFIFRRWAKNQNALCGEKPTILKTEKPGEWQELVPLNGVVLNTTETTNATDV